MCTQVTAACFIGSLQCLPERRGERHISSRVTGSCGKDGVGERCRLKGQIQETEDVLGCSTARAKTGSEWKVQECEGARDHPLTGLGA